MGYQKDFAITVEAIAKEKAKRPKTPIINLDIASRKEFSGFLGGRLDAILEELQDTERVIDIKDIKIAEAKHPDDRRVTFVALEVLEEFKQWYRNYKITIEGKLEALDDLNVLKIYDAAAGINKVIQLSTSNKIIYRSRDFPALEEVQKRLKPREYCAAFRGALTYLEVKNVITERLLVRNKADDGELITHALITVDRVKLKEFLLKMQLIYKKRFINTSTRRSQSLDLAALTSKQRSDYDKHDYKCIDKIYISGKGHQCRSNEIMINGNKLQLGDSLFILLLQLVVENKKGKDGWLFIDESKGNHQKYGNLRDKVNGSTLQKVRTLFIQNNKSKGYRISTHPDFVTYDRKALLEYPISSIQELAAQLPKIKFGKKRQEV